jgi:hypothetical protein
MRQVDNDLLAPGPAARKGPLPAAVRGQYRAGPSGAITAVTRLRRFNRHPWHASVSTSCTVLSRNRDQFLRIAAVRHSGRTPTAVYARHDYRVGFDAMQS